MLRKMSTLTTLGLKKLRVGYIPEHYSAPILFADKFGHYNNFGLKNVELIPYPSGSGHMITSLKKNEIDIVVGLTEAFVRGICNGDENYNIVGEYVISPLRWAVSTGINRNDLNNIEDLKKFGNNKIGVSRIGSGSYVMSFIMGLQENFPHSFEYIVKHNFSNLRESVNNGESDAFMWEYYTSKKYWTSGEIKELGSVYTPWSPFVICTSNQINNEIVKSFQLATLEGIKEFEKDENRSIDYILKELDYNSREDVEAWLSQVKFSHNVTSINWDKDIIAASELLQSAGVINESDSKILENRLSKFVLANRI